MNGQCSDRCFERVPGYIDVSILSLDNCKSLMKDKQNSNIAIPVCLLSEAEGIHQALYQSLLEEEEKS